MPVEVMAGVTADIAVTMVGMLSDMPGSAMLRADTLVSVLAVDVVTILRGPRADTRAMQVAHIIGMAAVTGEAITGIRLMDILAWAITAMAIHITGVAITVTTLTATDTGRR